MDKPTRKDVQRSASTERILHCAIELFVKSGYRATTVDMIAERAGLTKVHVFPYSPRPGTATEHDDPVPAHIMKERGAQLRALAAELERRRWRAKLGSEDTVRVDRPGRGYGDDYSPFLLDAPVGELIRVRATAMTEEGILAVAA